MFAISAETGKTMWRYDQRAGMMSVVATGGGLLFAGDTSGRFRAFDHDSGKILWETNLGAPVTGYPITYLAHGKQYVAVTVGNSLASSSINRPGRGVTARQRQQRVRVCASPITNAPS